MDALIFAAGLGTRLGPLSEEMPKALIEVGGVTMLERTARRLIEAGADRVIVNVHHHADRIAQFVDTHDLGADIVLSFEPGAPLETGGGLLHARSLFRDAPFFLHNVDVITDVDLRALHASHLETQPLATLAVNERETARRLLFDDEGLMGRVDTRNDVRTVVRQPQGEVRARAFAGIHVVSPAFFRHVTERGVFSILDPYLRLAGRGERILPYAIDGNTWLEIGTPERLEAARRALA